MRRFDAIPGLLQRKLGALGLAALLALPVPSLVARLELIAAHVTAVWFEVPPKPLLSAPLDKRGSIERTPQDMMCEGCCTEACVGAGLPMQNIFELTANITCGSYKLGPSMCGCVRG